MRLALVGALLLVAATLWLLAPFWELSLQLDERASRPTSHLYGAPLELKEGGTVGLDSLTAELDAMGYRRAAGEPLAAGYRLAGDGGRIQVRRTPTPRGWREAGVAAFELSGARIERLTWNGTPVVTVTLEAPVLAAYYGPRREERRPVRLEDLPEHLVQAVLAAEDSGFFDHGGLSVRGIARAAWVNLRGGELRLGGSTLTQQLVKNLFLTQERTFSRKAREAVLAVFVDGRYSKRAILNAYLNEIYWGSRDGTNLMGVGAAAWGYFGESAEQLDLCQSALLAAVIRSPGGYDPAEHPERARERRDWVYSRMVEEGWLTETRAAAARRQPLCYRPQPSARGDARYFADAVAREAAERFGVDDAVGRGLALLSTLRLPEQATATEAVDWGVRSLEEGWEKDHAGKAPLQAALVSIDPRSGALLAYVGGRDYGASQFDRVAQAARQAGSAFKPVVYATAIQNRVATPASWLEDEPLTVALAGSTWQPRNSDGEFRGWVTVRQALEKSLNVPTARLALATGLDHIVDTARNLGVRARLEPYPALALGAFEITPGELATVYTTLAAGGLRPPVHGLTAVLGPDGRPLPGRELPAPVPALDPATAYVVTSILQGVLDRGTAAGVRKMGVGDPLAGKTGTTNDRRDSWFAGFSPERSTLVWVGYDDNSTTRLSGARAALPIWARFVWRVRPPGGYLPFAVPDGVVTATIDPLSGQLATGRCPTVLTEAFLEGTVPQRACSLHGGFGGRPWRDRVAVGEEERSERRGLWRWLGKVLGRDKDESADEPPPD
ncbi:MAG: PBP1A family penicillin-binding protein [Thermoanaerobaculia bacterium]